MPAEIQVERPYVRDPVTGIIQGAEPFDLGKGSHAVLFIHGWTSSPRELRFLAQAVASAGFRCRGVLLEGHGRRLDDLVPTRFPEYLAQCAAAFDSLAAEHERVSVCGLSMGGLLGLHLALRKPVSGLVLLAPFLRPWGKTFGLPNRWLIGRVPLPAMLAKKAPGPIQDLQAIEGHIAYHAMPARSMVSVVAAGRAFEPLAEKVLCPTLLLHSVQDTTSDFIGSQRLIGTLGSQDKTLVAFNRSNHILTLDFDRQRAEETVVAWLDRRRNATPPVP